MSDWKRPLVAVSLILFASCTNLYDKLGGDFLGGPHEMKGNIGDTAKELISEAFRDVGAERLVDFHVHIIGMGTGDSGTFLNPRMRSLWHPFEYFRTSVYISASGIRDEDKADAEYVARLRALIRHIPGHGKFVIMAFDKYYHPDGTADLQRTTFYVPNEYVYRIAKKNPELFIPMISVHPYRNDALPELRKWAEKGVRFVKWLPNAMGIDPSDERIDPFYRLMKRHNMVLLSHTGDEQAVDADELQFLGNPLLLRRPLELGVQVIMGHSGSLGESIDIDSAGRPTVSNFELFLRMMDDPKYARNLYGEISTLVQFNRFDGPLQTLLNREDLHPRLVNGSDYPLPAVNVIVRTKDLRDGGFITDGEREALNEIYRYNPLLFDFVLKRTIRHPQSGRRFPPDLFTSPFQLK
ncbi:MAG: amidohydrolase family protein [SAR324 cluster bacterium]|nr:amidohydrolase family protein [SAR324 cluster bacterium]